MKKVNNFDFLRLLAAFTVVISHSVNDMGISFLWVTKESPYWIYDGVPIFFMISGYLVYKSCENCIEQGRPITQYFINRFLRIAPAIYVYLIVSVIGLLAMGVLHGRDMISPTLWAWIASTIFLVPVYHPQELSEFGIGVLNGSLWTIPAEFGFYLVLPLIVLGMKRFKGIRMFIILALISIIGTSLYDVYHPSEQIIAKLLIVSFIPYMLYFSLGIFWFKFWNKVSHHPMLFIGCIGIYFIIRYSELLKKTEPVYTILWAIPLSYAIMWFACYGGTIFHRVTEKLGDISYGAYIWHMVVINTLMHYKIFNVWLVLTITFGMALLSWWLIEKRALLLKPYNSNRKEIRTELLQN
jgi:peptidoglycan/LPS O-acetylase OafA/YrhL